MPSKKITTFTTDSLDMSSQNGSKNGGQGSEPAGREDQSVNRVRDLLIGRDLQLFDERFKLLEDKIRTAERGFDGKLDQKVEELQSEADKRVRAVRQHFEQLVQEQKTVIQELRHQIEKISEEGKSEMLEISKKIETSDQKTARELQEVSSRLFSELHQTSGDLNRLFVKEISAVEDDKLSRKDFAKELVSLASKIKNEKPTLGANGR